MVDPVFKKVLDAESVREKFSIVVGEFLFFFEGFFPVTKGD